MRRLALVSLLALAACSGSNEPITSPIASVTPTATAAAIVTAPPLLPFDRVSRADFNRLAADLDLPLFWRLDDASPGTLEPNELVVLWAGARGDKRSFLVDRKFTSDFRDAYERVVAASKSGLPMPADEAEKRRRAAVVSELDQGRQAVLYSDFTKASAEDKALVDHMMKISDVIERIYEKQLGVYGLDKDIPADDPASRWMFFRNHGPYCVAPKTDKDPSCSALPNKPPKISGLYPLALQKDPKFCEVLEKEKDSKALLAPFVVVVDEGGLKPKKYTDVWKDDMLDVSRELQAAADAITSPSEAALKAYLLADAQAFTDDEWQPADEAWAKMTSDNSKWYVRVAPDEVYDDACDHKAGFQVSFAKINPDSVAWRKKLDPVKGEMEDAVAKLAGAPYKSRKARLTFHLPDFIDIVVNAGDARSPSGATVGESLPNWGPVANEGRGRTVAMTNIGVDKDSLAALKDRLESLYCKKTMDLVDYDPGLGTMSTVLHEASHNLGPAHEYKVAGKTDEEIFGGPLASTFEELKAQTLALYFADWLKGRGLVDEATVAKAHVREMAWAFGHIAEGMYSADGKPKPYAQLASIQIGFLLKHGALAWNGDEMAPNGKDKGCVAIHLDKFAPAIAELSKEVAGIKGRGDKARAMKLRADLVDKKDEVADLRKVIEERWQRLPRPTFVYAIDR